MNTIREEIEELEKITLAPYATLAIHSKGRAVPEEPDFLRTCFMQDRDRIVHCKSFRRLKHKTQVYISPENDHYRTRLTHTLEVSQIAQTIGRALRLNTDLIEAIALGHDVGHTPFSHTGEEVLNRLLPGGFRHNENSIRVLTRIEQGRTGTGLNLSSEVLDGIRYHSGFGCEKSQCGTLEGQTVRYADKIAYVQHDIDDSMRAGVLRLEDIPRDFLTILGLTHSQRIGTLVRDLVETSRKNIETGRELRLSSRVDKALTGLREFMFEKVYLGPFCLKQRQVAIEIVETLFCYYTQDSSRLPDFYRQIAMAEGPERGAADYISGMTDNFCLAVCRVLRPDLADHLDEKLLWSQPCVINK